MGSDSGAEIRTVSGSSRNSEFSAETPVEPPSTIIELKVDEQICGEHDGHEERAQVTVSNILARAEEEDVKEGEENDEASILKKQDEGELEASKEKKKNEEDKPEVAGGKETEGEAVEEETDGDKSVNEDQSEAGVRKSAEASSQKLEADQEANAEKISENDEDDDKHRTADETEMKVDPGEGGKELERGEAQKKDVVESTSETSVQGDGEEKKEKEEKKSEISEEGPRTEVSPSAEEGPDMEVQANVEVSPSTEVVPSADKDPGVQGSPSKETSPSSEEGPSTQEGPGVQESPSVEVSPITEGDASRQEGPNAEKSPSTHEGSSLSTTEDGQSTQGVPSVKAPGVPESPSAETGFKPKDVQIARLDVSSVAMDTERLELRDTSAAVSRFLTIR